MGILMGALGGAGAAMQDMFSTRMKADLQRESQASESDLAVKRAQSLELFKANLETSQRTAQTGRIDAAAGRVVDESLITPRRGIIESGIADRENWTPEQQAAVDQSLAGDRQRAVADPKVRAQAAVATGDISPKDAAMLAYKDEAMLYKSLLDKSREDGRDDRLAAQEDGRDRRQQAYLDAREKLAEIKAAGKNGEGNLNREERMRYTSLLGDAGRRLTEAEKALSTLQKDPFSKLAKPGDARSQELDDLRATIKDRREEHKLYQSLLAGSQGTASSGATAKKADVPSIPAGLPTGSIQIGTSGGKPVYQKPNGERFQVQ